jgi:hypothetical protein
MKNTTFMFLTILFFCIFSVNVFSASLSDLLAIGHEQDEIEAALKDETKNYDKISSAVSENKISSGMSKEDIFKEYGQPSVSVPQNEGQTKAVYKPSSKSYFDNDKVTLLFDASDKLINITTGQN